MIFLGMTFLRATLFNLSFFIVTGISCLLFLPGLLLPRKQAMKIVSFFVGSVYVLERAILGLDYEVRGAEHLPKEGCYIVAAKHQSSYETFKLHILFKDPAVILKRELYRIPLWGRFLKKSDPIAIDRSSKESAQQIVEGAKHMKELGRPIIIFPQGTRVYTWQTTADKPYKGGAARMQAATGLTIIPMATNTGVFAPKHSWIKWPGKVVFEFLPPILPGQNPAEVTKQIETILESESKKLESEALAQDARLPRLMRPADKIPLKSS